MPANTERRAALLTRAEAAFTRHVVDGVSLRDLAPEMGVSVETARKDVDTFKTYLADVDRADLPAKRAVRLVELADVKAKALYVYERYKDTKPLTAIGALNTIVATLAHIRAIEGLDAPKEVRQEVDQRVSIRWGDE